MICNTQLQGEVDIIFILESHVPVEREGSDWKKMGIFYLSCSYEVESFIWKGKVNLEGFLEEVTLK